MRATVLTGALAMAFVMAATAAAETPSAVEPTRAEYVAAVEPICKRDTQRNKRILSGSQRRAGEGKTRAAGAQFIRASNAFGKTIKSIRAVPRPAADDARLRKWFGFLVKVKIYLRKVGAELKRSNRVKAEHEGIRAERAGNAANNVASIYDFLHCRLRPSRFR